MVWAWAAACGVLRRTWRGCVHRASTRARAPRRPARRRRFVRARSTSCSTPRSGTRCARDRSPRSSASCLSFTFLFDWLCSIISDTNNDLRGYCGTGTGTGRGSFCCPKLQEKNMFTILLHISQWNKYKFVWQFRHVRTLLIEFSSLQFMSV